MPASDFAVSAAFYCDDDHTLDSGDGLGCNCLNAGQGKSATNFCQCRCHKPKPWNGVDLEPEFQCPGCARCKDLRR